MIAVAAATTNTTPREATVFTQKGIKKIDRVIGMIV